MNYLRPHHVPRLENPFSSTATSANSAIQSLSRLNNRKKVVLTDSENSMSEDEQFQETFQRISFTNSQTVPKVMRPSSDIQPVGFGDSDAREKPISSDRVTFGQNRQPARPCAPTQIQRHQSKNKEMEHHHQIEEMQAVEPAGEETQMFQLIRSDAKASIALSKAKHRIPALITASNIVEKPAEENERLKGSLINQIKDNTFCQSEVVQQAPSMSIQTPRVPKRRPIFDRRPDTSWKQRTPEPRRAPLHQSHPKNDYSDHIARPERHVSPHYAENRTQRRVFERSVVQEQRTIYCPHAQCMMKTLQIIDKLTVSPSSANQKATSADERQKANLTALQAASLELSNELESLAINFNLEEQYYQSESTERKLKNYKCQLERLTSMLRDEEFHCSEKNGNQVLWNISLSLQRNSKTFTYLQITRQRYLMWKKRLSAMERNLVGLSKLPKKAQAAKLGELAKCMEDIKMSKIHVSETEGSYGFVHSYNLFIGHETALLEKALECIKADLMGRGDIFQ